MWVHVDVRVGVGFEVQNNALCTINGYIYLVCISVDKQDKIQKSHIYNSSKQNPFDAGAECSG